MSRLCSCVVLRLVALYVLRHLPVFPIVKSAAGYVQVVDTHLHGIRTFQNVDALFLKGKRDIRIHDVHPLSVATVVHRIGLATFGNDTRAAFVEFEGFEVCTASVAFPLRGALCIAFGFRCFALGNLLKAALSCIGKSFKHHLTFVFLDQFFSFLFADVVGCKLLNGYKVGNRHLRKDMLNAFLEMFEKTCDKQGQFSDGHFGNVAGVVLLNELLNESVYNVLHIK